MKKSLNSGILSHKPKNRAQMRLRAHNSFQRRLSEQEIIHVPLWKAILVTIGLCAMCFSFAYSIRPAPITITKIQHVPIDRPINACGPQAFWAKFKNGRDMSYKLSLTVPAKALREVAKR